MNSFLHLAQAVAVLRLVPQCVARAGSVETGMRIDLGCCSDV